MKGMPRLSSVSLVVPLLAGAVGCGGDSGAGRATSASAGITGVTTASTEGTSTGAAGTAGTMGGTGNATAAGSSGGTAGAGTATGGTTAMPPKFDVGAEGSGTTAGVVCDEVMFQAMAQRPDIMLVLDKSGSMIATWQFMGQTMTRWDSLYLTVENVVTQFDDKADFGAELFPKKNAGSGECQADNPVTVPVAPMNGQNILASIPQLGATVSGRTPMGSGVQVAVQHLQSIVQPNKPQAMILVADGGVSTSCGSPNTSAEIQNMLSQMFAAGVPTYVVGIDADTQDLQDQLNLLAQAGGTALPGPTKFYNAQDGNALLMMMEGIVEGVLSCTIDLDSEPDFPGFTKVSVDGMEWPEVNDCNSEDGWVWSVPYTQITLCGQACEDLKNSGVVDMQFLCPQG